MFYEQRTTVPESPSELRTEYEAEFASILENVGIEEAVEETGIDRERLEALANGESPEMSLEEAAEIQTLADGEPDAETIVTMAGEHLLLGMSSAVLDVEAVESHIEIDLEAKEIQQKIERRAPMGFEEFVHVQHVIVSRIP
ncbi:DUF5791 family protein [Natrialbaceae archaeon A-gly3]